jgi:hypothetical protein
VLRHSDLGTTSDYAKIDRTALQAVVQPWPGGIAMSSDLARHAGDYLKCVERSAAIWPTRLVSCAMNKLINCRLGSWRQGAGRWPS